MQNDSDASFTDRIRRKIGHNFSLKLMDLLIQNHKKPSNSFVISNGIAETNKDEIVINSENEENDKPSYPPNDENIIDDNVVKPNKLSSDVISVSSPTKLYNIQTSCPFSLNNSFLSTGIDPSPIISSNIFTNVSNGQCTQQSLISKSPKAKKSIKGTANLSCSQNSEKVFESTSPPISSNSLVQLSSETKVISSIKTNHLVPITETKVSNGPKAKKSFSSTQKKPHHVNDHVNIPIQKVSDAFEDDKDKDPMEFKDTSSDKPQSFKLDMSSLEKMDVSTFDNLILSASHHSPTFLNPHPNPKARKSGARFSSSSHHHAARRVSIGFSTSKSIASPQHNLQPAKSSTARKSLCYSSIRRPLAKKSCLQNSFHDSVASSTRNKQPNKKSVGYELSTSSPISKPSLENLPKSIYKQKEHMIDDTESSLSLYTKTIIANQTRNLLGDQCMEVRDTFTEPHPCCTCTRPGIQLYLPGARCQALDDYDGKNSECTRKVTTFELLSSSRCVPFMFLCDHHQSLLKKHHCCPICGVFCTQGSFLECHYEVPKLKPDAGEKVNLDEEVKKDSRKTDAEISSVDTVNTIVEATVNNTSLSDISEIEPTSPQLKLLNTLHTPTPETNGVTTNCNKTSSTTTEPQTHEESKVKVTHRYHAQCQVFSSDNKYYCPHCYKESGLLEVLSHDKMERSSLTNLASLNGEVTNHKLRARIAPKKTKSQDDPQNDIKKGPQLDFQTVMQKYCQDKTLVKKTKGFNKSLHHVCKSGDIGRLVCMIEEGLDLNADNNTQPIIHTACQYGQNEILQLLLNVGISVDSLDSNLRTPLMQASVSDHASTVKLLLRCGADVFAKDKDGMTALHVASQQGNTGVLNVLLQCPGLKIDVKDDGGWTPLIWATENNNVPCVSFLLSKGADPNCRDNEMNTCLHWASYSGSSNIGFLLLQHGCLLDALNDHGDTALHIAARQDHSDCVSFLLSRSANYRIKNKLGKTALECCIDDKCKSYNHLKTLSLLNMPPCHKCVCRDISSGREPKPITVMNDVDDDFNIKNEFIYVVCNIETMPLNINRMVSNLKSCSCNNNCDSNVNCACSHNSGRRLYDEDGRLVSDFNYLEPPLVFECNLMCKCDMSCANRVVQLGTIHNLQVVRTVGRGWGCITLKDIKKGTFVCEYTGELITDEEANNRPNDTYLFDLDIQEGENYCIDAAYYGNVSRFFNHLCEPNLVPVKVFIDHQDLRFPRICLFASQDITANSELGFDYGYKFWSIKWKEFTCCCGSPKCKYSKDKIQETLEEFEGNQDGVEVIDVDNDNDVVVIT